ncbi:MAG TPA: CRISPR system precrRNA processing endoribonuclease RAMP protein Cas6 [Bryobacteraceae bacterium]|nr:CRISPR system precrRNA processing endoribonuclease RAMP protein Cas6 [Bryobacteraceae bacterium]
MQFHLLHCRFHFQAIDWVRFEKTAGNAVRGAVGQLLRSLPCTPNCPQQHSPEIRNCAYGRIFRPSAAPALPLGYASPPRPFVLRTRSLDGLVVEPAGSFFIDLHLFAPDELGWFRELFSKVSTQGLGRDRGRAELLSVDTQAIQLPLQASDCSCHRLTMQFLTPTELKPSEVPPPFHVLFTRIRDRVSALHTLYANEQLDVDFRQLGLLSRAIQTADFSIEHCRRARTSSLTGQTHPIGGFIGWVAYQGNLGPFLPWLRAAEWAGVGRQTTWGKGEIQITVPAS